MQKTIRNYLTVDVEDYYHVSAFEHMIEFDKWNGYESRVSGNTRKLLGMLSDAGNVKATFFVLGWVAEKHPEIIKEINAEGHEIACHSYQHRCVYGLSPEEFREDTARAKNLLEDITGKRVTGYRAPSYSIIGSSLWAFDILGEMGFEYDSSIFPIRHDRYGIPGSPRFMYRLEQGVWEYPVSTVRFFGMTLPVSGGGYFRLLPFSATRMGLERINQKDKRPFLFYLHPWELDPAQPRIYNAGLISTFRHYYNLEKTEDRFKKLLSYFSFGPISNSIGL